MDGEVFSIGRIARETGIAVETVRYYERIGLMQVPPRTQGNYRAYRRDDLDRLVFIRRARDLGFSIDQVRALLALADQRETSCAAVDAIAREHLAQIERKLSDLQALRLELTGLLGQCRHATVAECRIIGAFARNPATAEDSRPQER